jgi:hypothetical protein
MSIAVSAESSIDHVEVTKERLPHTWWTVVSSVSRSLGVASVTPEQRANWKPTGNSHDLHWPDVDEDVSAEGLLHRVPAKRLGMVGISNPVPRNHSPRARDIPQGPSFVERAGAAEHHAGHAALSSFLAGNGIPAGHAGENELIL